MNNFNIYAIEHQKPIRSLKTAPFFLGQILPHIQIVERKGYDRGMKM